MPFFSKTESRKLAEGLVRAALNTCGNKFYHNRSSSACAAETPVHSDASQPRESYVKHRPAQRQRLPPNRPHRVTVRDYRAIRSR